VNLALQQCESPAELHDYSRTADENLKQGKLREWTLFSVYFRIRPTMWQWQSTLCPNATTYIR